MERTYQGMRTMQQADIYMQARQEGKNQEQAAAKAGLSKRTGGRIEHNESNGEANKPRTYKTRKGPFDEIWENDVVPQLQNGVSNVAFLLEMLQEKHSDELPDNSLRTLQRKVERWHALYGKDREVMFRQVYEPGKLGISDFTRPKKIKITINGQPFEHIFYHFRLPYSGFAYIEVFAGSGESFEKFAQGLQGALQFLGGTPETHRTDSLSASFKNLDKDAKNDLTERYKAFTTHYDMQPTRNNPGKKHENGAIESPHRHFKNRVMQSLIVRGSIDFSSLEQYRDFAKNIVTKHNKRLAEPIKTEKACLRPLPPSKAVDYAEVVAVVGCTSTINVRRVTYSVPNRLIGQRLHVRVYTDKLECYLGSTNAITLKRAPIAARGVRLKSIDYRHIISSLIKKPGAFARSCLRNDLLPNDNYRFIWEHVSCSMSRSEACKFIVGLLNLAANYDCENELEFVVMELIKNERPLKISELQDLFNKHQETMPILNVQQHSLAAYNQLIPDYQGAF